MTRRNPVQPEAGNPRKQKAKQDYETIADRVRSIAERIDKIGEEIVASFAFTDPNKRMERLRQIQTEISFGMLPVNSWLEMRRPRGTAELVRDRVEYVLREAVQCAGLEIPQYVGGTKHLTAETSPGAMRTAALVVTTKILASHLWDWGGRIETEDTAEVDLGKLRNLALRTAKNQSKPSEKRQSPPEEQAWLSAPDIASQYEVSLEVLRGRLRRWRRRNQRGWKTVEDRSPRESRYLYRLSDVMPIINEIKDKKRPSNARRKKSSR